MENIKNKPTSRNAKYPKVRFEDFYAQFKTVKEMSESKEWEGIYSNFYDLDKLELEVKIGEQTWELETLTAEERYQEFVRCASSFTYFCHRYIKILHPVHGTIPFVLYKYQRRVVEEYENQKFNIISKFRQGGLTTLAVLWALWKCLFKTDQAIYVLSKTDREAVSSGEIVQRALDNMPKWIYTPAGELSKHEKCFDTDSKVCFYTPKAARGKSASLIIIDEAAFIPDMHEHWKAMYPVIATGGSVIVISTVNGIGNWYEEMYHGAGADEDHPFHIIDLDYWEHPEYANPVWARNTRANLGEKEWLQEFERSFLGSGETYISAKIIDDLDKLTRENAPVRVAFSKWMNSTNKKSFDWDDGALWIWKEPIDGHDYIIGVDCAEGVGEDGDNSCFEIIDIATLEQVAEFYSNTVPPHILAQVLNQIGIYYNTALVVVENMSSGGAVLSNLQHDMAYENIYFDQKSKRLPTAGVKVSSANRNLYLEAMQHRLINGTARINSTRFVKELKTFIFNPKTKKAEAQRRKHDDAIIALCLALHTRDAQMRGIPVGAEVPEEMVKVFKTEVYEEIKREILEGSPEDWITQDSDDPILIPNRDDILVGISFNIKRRHDKILKDFGW